VLAPSFPANQRYVHQGWLALGAARERRFEIAPFLAAGFPGDVVRVDVALVEAGASVVADALRGGSRRVPTLAVADALDNGHLETVVRAARLVEPATLLAGSAGLTAAIARLAGNRATDP